MGSPMPDGQPAQLGVELVGVSTPGAGLLDLGAVDFRIAHRGSVPRPDQWRTMTKQNNPDERGRMNETTPASDGTDILGSTALETALEQLSPVARDEWGIAVAVNESELRHAGLRNPVRAADVPVGTRSK